MNSYVATEKSPEFDIKMDAAITLYFLKQWKITDKWNTFYCWCIYMYIL